MEINNRFKKIKIFLIDQHIFISSIYYNLINTYAYSYIIIGETEYTIKTKFSFSYPYFSITSNYELIDEEKKLNYYNIENSKTFINISCLNQYYVESMKDCAVKEKLKINSYNIQKNEYKEIIFNDCDLVLGIRLNNQKKDNLTEIYFLTMGLQAFNSKRYTQELQFTFISFLKQKK